MAEEDLFNTRLNKANELRAAGHNPFANDYSVDTTVATFVERYQGLNREQLEQETAIHHVAGRVLSVKRHGKASFLHIQDGSCDQSDPAGDSVGVLQIYLRKNNVGDTVYDEVFGRLDIGDIVGITGTAMRTKTDMLTLQAQSFRILTKSLRPLPDKWHGLSDQETRYRRRYVDLIVNSEVRNTFRKRSLVIRWLRDFFASRDFLEVETPMMHPIAGGAAARPFETHHNTLDLELYLRIAPELYLKRLVVGGFERVFEINRNFRNEGISTFHNPEFTMLEFYQSYTDYLGLMKIGEEMLSGVAQAVCGTTELTYGEYTISFAAPFKRMTMIEAIAVHGGPSAATVSDPTAARLALKEVGIELADDCSHGHLIVALFEYFAEEKLIQPTFIYDFPASVSPLSRLKDGDSTLVDRFELFAAGHELGNAFSELNDPIDQRQRFEAQLAAKAAGDDEAHEMDEDYIRALEHGMPPTGGFGLGIDRLVMLLTNSSSIRDVILFPQLRSRKGADPDSTVPDSTEQGKTTEGHE